jgi:hypothetical protein
MGGAEAGQAFIVGAQRCGTTSLATALERHPHVAFAQPRRPEPKCFLVPGAADDVGAYLARFYADAGPEVRLRCEKSTSYLGSDLACGQIAEAFPNAHVVVLLRDPVDRAVSHYRFSRSAGVEDLPIEEALEPSAEDRPWDTAAISVSPYRYLTRGRYVDDLGRWFSAFPRSAVHVELLEDLIAEPSRFTTLLGVLGLDPVPGAAFAPELRHNASEGDVALDTGARARLAAWFADANADLASMLGRPITRWS